MGAVDETGAVGPIIPEIELTPDTPDPVGETCDVEFPSG